MIRKNDIFDLDITDMTNLGSGVGKKDGITVFVPGAVDGDRLRVKVIKTAKSYLVARSEMILVRSPNRVDGGCPSEKRCGGCVYQNISYEHELALKESCVRHAFIKAGLSDVRVNSVISAGRTDGYRNKAQYPIARDKKSGEVRIGFYAAKTHEVAGDERCALLPSEFAAIAAYTHDFIVQNGVSVYDEESGRGLLRHLYLRAGAKTGEIMAALVINGREMPLSDSFAENLTKQFPAVKTVVLNINEKPGNVVLGSENILLSGRGWIEDELCCLRFRLSPGAFYQVNHDGAQLLYTLARSLAGLSGGETVLDLYCGIGTIGLTMASEVKNVVGVEIVPEAVEKAKENAAINGITNASFFCRDAANALSLPDPSRSSDESARLVPDVIVLDPPRKGCDARLINDIAALGVSRVVYISCNPDTLARDAAVFRSLGYEVGAVTPVDMFPRTGHVEACVLLSHENP